MKWVCRFAAMMTALGLLSGCSNPPPHMYVMSGLTDDDNGAVRPPEPIVAIVRVRLPDYLDRSEIVSRRGTNSLELANNDRWGEPLSDSLPRIYAQDLSHFIKGGRVVIPSEGRGRQPQYEYAVTLDAYEPTSDGQAVMRGHWRLVDLRNGKVIAEGAVDETRPVATGDYSAIVHALNDNLTDSSRQIAEQTAGIVGQ
jgi:uncharacterized protein